MSVRIRSNRSQLGHSSCEGGQESCTNSADEHILGRLNKLVVDRFARLTGLRVMVAPIGASSLGTAWAIPDAPRHPDCAEFPCTDYCKKMWEDSIRQVLSRPVTHWHRCKFGMLCALVPVVWDDRRLAVCQMVCAQSEGEEHFERAVEMLEVLIENYLAHDAEYLARRIAIGADKGSACDQAAAPAHPAVRRAIGYIERNLSNPSMTVASVAREAEMNPSYMAHLFSQQTGMRMSRHIAERRLEVARRLLVETDWQIKRVAIESGHANADWFSHLFHLHTGATPTQYRRKRRESG